MADNYLTLIVLGAGFSIYFLISRYGPSLYDLIFNTLNKEAKE